MGKAQEHVQAFHTWHSARTYSAGHPQIDPWMRDVLVALQSTLNSLAAQIDETTQRVDRMEDHLRGR